MTGDHLSGPGGSGERLHVWAARFARAGAIGLTLVAGIATVAAIEGTVSRGAPIEDGVIPLALTLLGASIATHPPTRRLSRAFGWASFGVALVGLLWNVGAGLQ